MAEIIQLGHPPIEVNVRRSARARRLSLRVSGVDGKVSLTLPLRAPMREAQSFLNEKEPWIRSHVSNAAPLMQVGRGMALPVEGQPREIVETASRVVRLHPHWIEVPNGAEKAGARLQAFLKTLARERLAVASDRYASELGRAYGRLTIRDTRSRWGSCTSEGNLMYSWRLVMAPPEVLDYVAAHEVSHLQHMDHSRAFWSTVGSLKPGYEKPRRWLKEQGGTLHRYIFAH